MLRTEESTLTSWYFEIDRRLMLCVLGLILVGMISMITAGSVAAERIGQPWHFFILKALPFYAAGLGALLITSMLPRKTALQFAYIMGVVCFIMLLLTLVMPAPVKGSHRWLNLGFASVMPSDLLKPGFIIATAWFLARLKKIAGSDIFTSKRVWRWDGWPAYLALLVPAVVIILIHPDLGTAVLYIAVFGAMIFSAGLPLKFLPLIGGAAGLAGLFAFMTMPHVRARLLGFVGLGGEGHDNYQVSQSVQSIQHGGLLGSGEDSFVKQSLPDAHTDFIFAAISEDYGAIIACILLCVMLYVLKRLAFSATRARDPIVFYTLCGTMALFGVQVCINIMTTLHIIPPKGMTLPFISYGGSSFMGFCILFGLSMALIREDKWGIR